MKPVDIVVVFTLGFVFAVVLCGAALKHQQDYVRSVIQTQCGER